MNNRERVLAALNHKQPDKTPYSIDFTQGARRAVADYLGDDNFESGLENCFTHVGWGAKEEYREVRPKIWQDMYGVQWDKTVDEDIGTVCNTAITPENFDAHVWPDPANPDWYENAKKMCTQRKPDEFMLGSFGFSLYERAWTMTGMENMLVAMVGDKEYAHKLLDRILEFNLQVIDRLLACGVDGVRFGDDWGTQTGLQMGPALWREFIKPRIKEMYGAVKSKGKYVFIHSCGMVQEVFPDLIELGLDCFNPFQPEVMDVKEMKEKFGDRLSFYGGISTQKTLPYGTAEETREEVKMLMDVVGKNGGYFASPAHAIPKDANPENVVAMLEVLRNQ